MDREIIQKSMEILTSLKWHWCTAIPLGLEDFYWITKSKETNAAVLKSGKCRRTWRPLQFAISRQVACFTVVSNESWRSKWNFLVCHHCTAKNISIYCIHTIRIKGTKSASVPLEIFLQPRHQRIQHCLVELPKHPKTVLGLKQECIIKCGKGNIFVLKGLRLSPDCMERF